jgi:hypothetical protein
MVYIEDVLGDRETKFVREDVIEAAEESAERINEEPA